MIPQQHIARCLCSELQEEEDQEGLRVKGQCQEMCQLKVPGERAQRREMMMNEWRAFMKVFQGNRRAFLLLFE